VSAFLRAVMLLMVVCDPLGALAIAGTLTKGAGRSAVAGFALAASGTAFVALGASALSGEWVLNVLDLSPGSVTLAAAVVLVVPGAWLVARGDRRMLVRGTSGAGLRAAILPVAFPVLAGPGALLVTVSLSVTRGAGTTVAAAAVVALVAGGLIATGSEAPVHRYPVVLNRAGGRVVGAVILVVALALAIEGILGY